MNPPQAAVGGATMSRARRLLTPRWAAFTVFVVLAVGAFLFLAWWQLRRFESSTGNWQNLGYTLQWPFFAAFAVYLWWKLLGDADAPPSEPSDSVSEVQTDGALTGTSVAKTQRDGDDLLPPLPPKRVGAAIGSRLDEAGEAEDPELAAYNKYLAALHRRSQESV
ncbi:hypothetical protein [Actinopolymorpha alba]|uniref:hypothetical protein n=1 Tax=Actinopolymorpha alba TaxID=533267 RepID=UPI0003636848|nr:hypothetical protein [Actinopolymorpha alba]